MTLNDQNQTPPNGGGNPPPGDTGGQAPDWLSGLTPEFRTLVESKGYKTPADVVQAYAHAQRAIGERRLPVPKEGVWDDPEARKLLGIPDDPKGYEIQRPELPQGLEWDTKFEEAALAVGHKLGLTPKQLNGLVAFFGQYQGESFKAQVEAKAGEFATGLQALKTEFGQSFDTKVAQAKAAAKFAGGEELLSWLNQSGQGNNPALIRAFAKIGAQLGESGLITGNPAGFAMTPKEAQAEINKLMAHPAYMDGMHPEHKALVEKVQGLWQMVAEG